LEVPHLLHKDEPHVRRFSQPHCRLHLFDYIHARQKFRIRASSGNPVIYNSSSSWLWGRIFFVLRPHIPTLLYLFLNLLQNFGLHLACPLLKRPKSTLEREPMLDDASI